MLLNSTCLLNSIGYTQGSDGSIAALAAQNTTPVPCSLQPKSASEAMEYQRQYGLEGFNLYLPYTYLGLAVSVSHGDTVTCGGVTYKVRGPAMDMAGRHRFLKVNLELPK